MSKTSARPADEIETIVNNYGDMLFRICLLLLGNPNDAEDAIQETMLTYLQKAPLFRDAEHQKAWLITVATNKSKDILRFRSRHPVLPEEYTPDSLSHFTKDTTDSDILDALMTLPEKYRLVLILYYVEEYSMTDIAKIIGRTTSAVKMRLQKGRKLLSETYQKEYL